MKLFRRVSQILGLERDRTREQLFGLSADEIVELREWRNSEGFRAYCALLDATITLYADGILATRDDAALHETRGMVLGLRKAASLVDEAIRQAEELDARAKRNHESERLAADPRIVSLYGSPAFGRAVSK